MQLLQMMDELRDLFKVKGFYTHFLVTSIVYLLVPNLIFKLFAPHSNEMLLHGHMWFLNFDGIHYFNNNYEYEPNHAFLPLYVKFIQLFISLAGQAGAIAFLILVNKLAFLVAASDLHIILRNLIKNQYERVSQDQKRQISNQQLVNIGLLFFLYNPAGIFFNVLYTESLFCMITFRAVRYILQQQSEAASVGLMALSVGIRSNGMFLAPVIGLEVLYSFFKNLRTNLGESAKALLKGLSIIVSLCLPFIMHNVFAYYNICQAANHKSDMCKGGLLSFYGSVQERYWAVGFLKYFNLRNTLFIIIGTPAIVVAFFGLFYYSSSFNLRQKGLYLSFLLLFTITAFFTNIQSSTRFFCGHPFFYYAIACLSVRFGIIKLWAVFYWLIGLFMYVVAFPWT